MITLYNRDYKELDIKEKSQNLILIDPPYGKTKCDWDKPFDEKEMWGFISKIILDNGVVAIFGQEPFSTNIRCSNKNMYRYDWYWIKNNATNPFLARKRPMRVVENIMIFYNKQPVYNPQMRKGKPYIWNSKRTKGEAGGIYLCDDKPIINNGDRFPIDTLFIKQERGLHPTQKPVEILEYIIKTYTNENDNVIDFCMGSASTGIAALNLNRNFIGNDKYIDKYNISKERLLNHIQQNNIKCEVIFNK